MEDNGLTDIQYANWLSDTAVDDCDEVGELYVLYNDDSDDTFNETGAICAFMQNATSSLVSDIKEVTFSGIDGEEQPWYAIDERISSNLERTENFASVPIKIRRPTGT